MFENADAYERFIGRWSRALARGFLNFSGLPKQGRILDVGSGTGSLAFTIAEHCNTARIMGIDSSKEYIAYANSENPFPDRAGFEAADARHLGFESASFDGALSLLAFNFIPDPGKALAEARRVVKPGGVIAAAVWDYGSGMRMLRTFWDAAVRIDPEAEKSDEKHMPLCREGELTALWRSGGLVSVREEPIEISMRFATFADYWEPFLLGQGPAGAYARRLDPDRLAALRGEIQRRLSLKGEDQPFDLSARAWAARGVVPNDFS
jgi:SAM-dependent methyltransferase